MGSLIFLIIFALALGFVPSEFADDWFSGFIPGFWAASEGSRGLFAGLSDLWHGELTVPAGRILFSLALLVLAVWRFWRWRTNDIDEEAGWWDLW